MTERIIDKKREMQIRRAILKFEKGFDNWPDSPRFLETRFFKITYKFHIDGNFGVSAESTYYVIVKEDNCVYGVRHWLGNPQFDRSTGWSFWKGGLP